MSALALEDAKAHLNVTQNGNDAEIMRVVASAEAAISRLVGPLEPTGLTVRVPGGVSLALPVRPAISLTSVTPVAGSALTLSDLYLNTTAATVSYALGWRFSAVAYDVVYQAGRTDVPDDLLLAVKELVRHMWESQRGGSQRPGSRSPEALSNTLPGAAYTFPIRVTELLAPHMSLGFA